MTYKKKVQTLCPEAYSYKHDYTCPTIGSEYWIWDAVALRQRFTASPCLLGVGDTESKAWKHALTHINEFLLEKLES